MGSVECLLAETVGRRTPARSTRRRRPRTASDTPHTNKPCHCLPPAYTPDLLSMLNPCPQECSCKTNVGGIPVLRLSPTGNPIPGCGCAGGSRRKLGKRAHPLPPPAPQNLAPRALAARFRPPPPGPLTSLSPAKIAANRSVYAVHSVWPPSIHKKARRGRHVARRREGGLSRRPAPAADASAECTIERNGRFVGA
ncbi:hypothetical protein B5X24_HaOG205678 [Helicoverpa armigera]|uniref:Uncharacterized protein n=1 Tax=Helicoverpa armigera TaxID=29058 RepID=A0A2W1BNB3_HELAM|nr:hypothetical protein B5X24_HaOG205678 [Helicoverpa armigera]